MVLSLNYAHHFIVPLATIYYITTKSQNILNVFKFEIFCSKSCNQNSQWSKIYAHDEYARQFTKLPLFHDDYIHWSQRRLQIFYEIRRYMKTHSEHIFVNIKIKNVKGLKRYFAIIFQTLQLNVLEKLVDRIYKGEKGNDNAEFSYFVSHFRLYTKEHLLCFDKD